MSDLNPQLLELIRDRFDKQDTMLETITASLKEHVSKDEGYWRKIDQQEAQVSLLKWLAPSLGGTGLIAWLYEHFLGKH